MQRFVLPKPGEGPSPAAQLAGYFDVSLLGKNTDQELSNSQSNRRPRSGLWLYSKNACSSRIMLGL